MAIQIRAIDEAGGLEWDAFVREHSSGSPFHLTAWKRVIEQVFAFRSVSMVATDCGEIKGVLPLFLVRDPWLRKALISSPFAVYGGILAASDEARRALYDRAFALGQELGVEYIELRNGHPEQTVAPSNVDRYATFTKAVSASEEDLFESLPKKTRNMARKALKSRFTTRIDTEHFGNFERLHSETLHRLGTPCFPRRHFKAILQHFKGMVDVREVLLEERVVAASLNFYFRKTMHTYYAASDQAFNALAPNTFMYFDHLRWAGQNGYSTFEFGRSKKGTGPFEFKTHWGTEMRVLPYNMVLIRGRKVPNYSPTNHRFSLAIDVWKRLPAPVTRVLGPQLIRMFP